MCCICYNSPDLATPNDPLRTVRRHTPTIHIHANKIVSKKKTYYYFFSFLIIAIKISSNRQDVEIFIYLNVHLVNLT